MKGAGFSSLADPQRYKASLREVLQMGGIRRFNVGAEMCRVV